MDEEKRRGKKRKYLENENIWSVDEMKSKDRKEDIIWRRFFLLLRRKRRSKRSKIYGDSPLEKEIVFYIFVEDKRKGEGK